MKVPLTMPLTGDDEKKLVEEVISSGWLTQGPQVTRFEEAVAKSTGAPHAVAFSNCTTALHVALLLYGIGPGDEVIVPSYTWIATANVVRMVGATPVFADIDLKTFNITAETVEKSFTPKTKLVLVVHQFGLPADMDRVVKVAEKRRIPVIEDAACALGSAYKGRPIGAHGRVACFSFHPRKLITTGEGGMMTVHDEKLAARARVLLNHGASVSDLHKHAAGTVEALLSEEFHELGFNYRLTNLQGALGVAQMKRLPEILNLRRARAKRYTDGLSRIKNVHVPHIPADALPNWQSYAVRIDESAPVSRNAVAQSLLDHDIAVRPAYMACHLQPTYRGENPDLPQTMKALASVIILPIFPQMTDEQQDFVMERLEAAMSGKKAS